MMWVIRYGLQSPDQNLTEHMGEILVLDSVPHTWWINKCISIHLFLCTHASGNGENWNRKCIKTKQKFFFCKLSGICTTFWSKPDLRQGEQKLFSEAWGATTPPKTLYVNFSFHLSSICSCTLWCQNFVHTLLKHNCAHKEYCVVQSIKRSYLNFFTWQMATILY